MDRGGSRAKHRGVAVKKKDPAVALGAGRGLSNADEVVLVNRYCKFNRRLV